MADDQSSLPNLSSFTVLVAACLVTYVAATGVKPLADDRQTQGGVRPAISANTAIDARLWQDSFEATSVAFLGEEDRVRRGGRIGTQASCPPNAATASTGAACDPWPCRAQMAA